MRLIGTLSCLSFVQSDLIEEPMNEKDGVKVITDDETLDFNGNLEHDLFITAIAAKKGGDAAKTCEDNDKCLKGEWTWRHWTCAEVAASSDKYCKEAKYQKFLNGCCPKSCGSCPVPKPVAPKVPDDQKSKDSKDNKDKKSEPVTDDKKKVPSKVPETPKKEPEKPKEKPVLAECSIKNCKKDDCTSLTKNYFQGHSGFCYLKDKNCTGAMFSNEFKVYYAYVDCSEKLSEWTARDLKDFVDNMFLHKMNLQNFVNQQDAENLKMSQREFNERASQRNWANWGKFATLIISAAIVAFVVLVALQKIIFNFAPA